MKLQVEPLPNFDIAYDKKDNRFRRKEPVGMERLVQQFIREMKLTPGMNRQRAVEAWNTVSGASRYTLDVTLEKGVLYVALNSSMARNQLYFQRDVLKQKMNELLENDPMFIKGDSPAVINIVLK